MRILCVGGGPTGLYFGILAKLRDPGSQVTVVERNPRGVVKGWGVTWSEDFLDDLYAGDPVTARQIEDSARVWTNQEVRIEDHPPVFIGGLYGYATGRSRMNDILVGRAEELGVDLQFDRSVEPGALPDADLVVAADGVGSRLRSSRESAFRPQVTPGATRFLWLGTTKVFTSFQFAFRRVGTGWLWAFGYPTSDSASTMVIECAEPTWTALGLDAMELDACLALMRETFAAMLDGHPLLEPPAAGTRSAWGQFREIRNGRWRAGNLVLAGDAAHTTHFGTGAGTVLAMQDVLALSRQLFAPGADPDRALDLYDAERRAHLGHVQDQAMRSLHWFETADERLDGDPVQVAYSLFDRRGNQAPWRYQVHLATQIEPLRRIRTRLTTARRTARLGQRERG